MEADRMVIKRSGKAKYVIDQKNSVQDVSSSFACTDEQNETHYFPAGSDRCKLCKKLRSEIWPEEEPVVIKEQ
jgi:hypothetical protein